MAFLAYQLMGTESQPCEFLFCVCVGGLYSNCLQRDLRGEGSLHQSESNPLKSELSEPDSLKLSPDVMMVVFPQVGP